MLILLLACTAGPESSTELELPPIPRVEVTEGFCAVYPDFEVDPTATIIVTTCVPDAQAGPRCGSEFYRVRPRDGHIQLEDCAGGAATGTWKVTQIFVE